MDGKYLSGKRVVHFLAGLVLSGTALYFSFKNIPLHDLVLYSRKINYYTVLPSSMVLLAGFAVRAFRWQIILKAVKHIRFSRVYHPLMIGFMLNCVLPARIGEFARPAILKKNEHLPFTTGITTIIVERVFDIFFLVLFFVLLLIFIEIDPDISIHFGNYTLGKELLMTLFYYSIGIAVFSGAMIFLLSFGGVHRIAEKLIMTLPFYIPFISKSLKTKIENLVCIKLVQMLKNISAGFLFIKNPGSLLICIACTLVAWGCAALSQYIMVLGCPGIDLNFFESFAVLIIICFFISLPSVPGFWGIWEAGGIFAISLFGITGTDAAGFTLINHAVQIFPIILAGIFSGVIYSLGNAKQIRYEND
jgi:glycosyltransferase 2 family protein